MEIGGLLKSGVSAKPPPSVTSSEEENQGATKWMVIDSKLLGEHVIFCFGKHYLKEIRVRYPDMVVYFLPELEVLVQLSDDAIRQVHMVKKKTKGWINPRESNPRPSPETAKP